MTSAAGTSADSQASTVFKLSATGKSFRGVSSFDLIRQAAKNDSCSRNVKSSSFNDCRAPAGVRMINCLSLSVRYSGTAGPTISVRVHHTRGVDHDAVASKTRMSDVTRAKDSKLFLLSAVSVDLLIRNHCR